MANGITIVAGISISTKIAGSDTGVSVGPGIVGNNPDLNVGGQSLLTSSGVALQTDAGVQINTSN